MVAHQGRCAGGATRSAGQRTRRGPTRASTRSTRWRKSCKRSNDYHDELVDDGAEHPLCGRPSVCVSTIHGGVGINTVPERATIEIDRRLAPEKRRTAAYERAHATTSRNNADIGRCRVEHDPPFMESIGLSDQHNRALG